MVSVYLDTSGINFLFADDAPEMRDITIDFFDNFIKKGVYDTYISEFVLQEILQTADVKKREALLQVITDYGIRLVDLADFNLINKLADSYIFHGVVPEKKRFDALHVACAVIQRIDYLASWNYKHLANVNRERKVAAVNLENEYLHTIRIITPIELIDYGN